jgi:hypothetical protein
MIAEDRYLEGEWSDGAGRENGLLEGAVILPHPTWGTKRTSRRSHEKNVLLKYYCMLVGKMIRRDHRIIDGVAAEGTNVDQGVGGDPSLCVGASTRSSCGKWTV